MPNPVQRLGGNRATFGTLGQEVCVLFACVQQQQEFRVRHLAIVVASRIRRAADYLSQLLVGQLHQENESTRRPTIVGRASWS